MRELVWDKTLSVSIDEIDEDHRRLVELLNIFSRAVDEDKSAEYRKAVLEELIACTVWHFRHEERLMLQYNFPGLPGHKYEHNELIESITAFQKQYLENKGVFDEADFDHLEQWLTGHILVVDMKLGEWLSGVM